MTPMPMLGRTLVSKGYSGIPPITSIRDRIYRGELSQLTKLGGRWFFDENKIDDIARELRLKKHTL